MKKLLAFTAFLAAGFLLGNRRARKPVQVVTELRLRSKDFVTASQRKDYRSAVTG